MCVVELDGCVHSTDKHFYPLVVCAAPSDIMEASQYSKVIWSASKNEVSRFALA